MSATALWYVAPGRAELRAEALGEAAPGDVTVRSLFGALSRGTESLVFHGRVPASEHARMAAPFQAGALPFPVKYGYATVGLVEAGPAELLGRQVFALYPHQSRFHLPATAVLPLPDGVPPMRAVLAANLETALNALWDAAAGPGDRIAVIGAGVVGALTGALAGALPGSEVTLVDVDPARAGLARALGLGFALPADCPRECDLVIHASGRPEGLATALEAAGEEATILDLSWYGDAAVSLPLGGAFHARRLRIQSSQVGQVSPSRRARWSHRRRLAKALALLVDPRFDALLAEPCDFADLPARLPALLAPGSRVLAQVIRYPQE